MIWVKLTIRYMGISQQETLSANHRDPLSDARQTTKPKTLKKEIPNPDVYS